ncbi:methyltransferase [Nonomuraea typhae]|uniref:Methyltransferase n=1 Tax=Nonomuraea typhae TaxID=2603600 RepID=A0ABW7Z9I6_9ACTN
MTESDERPGHEAARMRELIYGGLVSRCVCLAAQLGLAELLAGGPRPVGELAGATGVDPAALLRLLRGLASQEIFAERPGGAFALTPLGRTLCRDAPSSAQATALLVSGPVGAAWTELPQTVRTGESPFQRRFGRGFFDCLELDPDMRAVFDRSQAHGLELELEEVLSAVDLSPYSTIVDVGGGDGLMLGRFLRASPQAKGVLFDLPATVAMARERLEREGLLERCSLVEGDFFDRIPGGGDLYLLSHVLHDWGDREAVAVLRTCRAAMAPGSVLMVIDLAAPGRAGNAPADRAVAVMDLYMMSLFGGAGGRERTSGETLALLGRAGLHAVRSRRLPSGMGVIEAVTADASARVPQPAGKGQGS